MKILSIPDVHQTLHWKKAVAEYFEQADKVVFLGDYNDSHGEPEVAGLLADENLREIIKLKLENPDKVILLIGNHDLHYLLEGKRGSEFQREMYPIFHNTFKEYKHLFQIAVELDGWLFSHAGLSNTWLALMYNKYPELSNLSNIDLANELLQRESEWLWYIDSYEDMWGTGNARIEGPCWIRPESLLVDSVYDNMVVGHTGYAHKKPFCIHYKDIQLMCLDSQDKDVYYLLDTENPPEFFDLATLARQQKDETKKEQDLKSIAGNVQKELRDELGVSKAEFKEMLTKTNSGFMWNDETAEDYKLRVMEVLREKFGGFKDDIRRTE